MKNLENPVAQLLFRTNQKRNLHYQELTRLEGERLLLIKNITRLANTIIEESTCAGLKPDRFQFIPKLNTSKKLGELRDRLVVNKIERKKLAKKIKRSKNLIQTLCNELSGLGLIGEY